MISLTIGVEITAESSALRADEVLTQEIRQRFLPSFSRNRAKQWIATKSITYREKPGAPLKALAPSLRLRGPFVEIRIEGLDATDLAPARAHASMQGSFLPVIYQDDQLLVLNKSHGIPSQPLSPLETETAVGSAIALLPELSKTFMNSLEPGLVHRLDVDTSGVLCFAKDEKTLDFLQRHWNRSAIPRVRKWYRAIVHSTKRVRTQRIDHAIERNPKSTKRMQVSRKKTALTARTYIRAANPLGKGLWDLTIEIETGVQHQIRCHLAHIHSPILGDDLYRGKKSSRLWLHAWRAEIPKPQSKKTRMVEAPLPADWPVAQS